MQQSIVRTHEVNCFWTFEWVKAYDFWVISSCFWRFEWVKAYDFWLISSCFEREWVKPYDFWVISSCFWTFEWLFVPTNEQIVQWSKAHVLGISSLCEPLLSKTPTKHTKYFWRGEHTKVIVELHHFGTMVCSRIIQKIRHTILWVRVMEFMKWWKLLDGRRE